MGGSGCRNRRIPPSFLGVAVAMLVGAASSLAPAQVPDLPGWKLAWQDEFAGTTVNTTNWNVLQNLQNSQNNELQYYQPAAGDGHQ